MNKKNLFLTFIILKIFFIFTLLSFYWAAPANAAWQWDPREERESFLNPQMVDGEKDTWQNFIEPNLLPFTADWSGGGAGGAYNSDQGWHPSLIIMRVINIIYTLLAVVFLAFMVFAGFSWMFAFGNKDKVSKALMIIRNAAIGLGIIVLAYAITIFIFHGLARATGV